MEYLRSGNFFSFLYFFFSNLFAFLVIVVYILYIKGTIYCHLIYSRQYWHLIPRVLYCLLIYSRQYPKIRIVLLYPLFYDFSGISESIPYYGAGLEDFDCVRRKLLFFWRLKIILLWETFPKCIPNGKWGFGGEKKWWGRDGATATVCRFFAPFRRVNIPPIIRILSTLKR